MFVCAAWMSQPASPPPESAPAPHTQTLPLANHRSSAVRGIPFDREETEGAYGEGELRTSGG
eukprot:scaffold17876_cov132-Isochrysis_galbana.AAC.3